MLEALAVDVLDGEGAVVEVGIVDAVEVDGHSVTTLTKGLDAAGRAELVVNHFLVELVGGHTFLPSNLDLTLWHEGEDHAFPLTVAAVTADAFSDISLDF